MPLTSSRLILLVTLFIVITANLIFWNKLLPLTSLNTLQGSSTLLGFFALLIWILASLPLLLGMKYLLKPILILILIISAVVSYFQNEMGVIINESMIQSLLETNTKEATEFLSLKYFTYLIGLGLIPAALVIWVPLKATPFWRDWLSRLGTWLLLTIITAIIVWFSYKDLALIGREQRDLRMNLNPYYAINSTFRYFYNTAYGAPKVLTPIAADAQLINPNKSKKNVVLFILGETARRDHFSLAGYARETNPELAKYNDLIFYQDVWACGTATAESLPCIYSHLNHNDFSVREAWQFQNITDVLKRTGISGYWRDNNTGCKGVCSRINNEEADNLAKAYPQFCDKGECYDEILLQGLTEKINASPNDVFITLHQKGSHGPAYYQRYPQPFARFTPECKDNAPQNCERNTIINAYDNTILYTDYVLKQAIEYLKQHEDEFNSVLFYVSDHGESLGENGIYLHGLPYLIAPDAQKQVPMLLWFSKGYRDLYPNKVECAAAKTKQRLSHDYVFHTLLGLFDIKTTAYQANLDLVTCPE
ncbi:phosphoethanolamine transferase [Thiofilum flexile]|uniref:phosphoethanolamine transferase n=1 Tax=Thiofilum flexile TaxID=125627 RepID=UPI00037DB912|nr:phosphoethanolamine--lipid A transferase [Thiofilum flexile]